MPRPGPRPYECVRRAWHSERHQPMRGSIIQQIFRVVHESHSSQTKKNMEWQEKLPTVVLKTEEIMYSKANSEAEYVNLDTLWDRVNDAINTIIRRDESTETGELLPPCVEVRASRSQRHSNPRTYLNLRPQESTSVPPRMVDKTIEVQCPKLLPLPSEDQLNFARSNMNANSALPVPESNCHFIGNDNLVAPPTNTSVFENITTGHSKMMTAETNSPLNLGLVYPLYYGTHFQTERSQLNSQVPENANSNTIFIVKPVATSISEPAEMGALPNLFSCPASDSTSTRITQPDFGNIHRTSTECDLSLRLGLSANPGISMDRNSARETEDVGLISSQDTNRFSDLSSHRNKEFCFFPEKTADDHRESCSSKWFSDRECQNLGVSVKKPKVPFSHNLEDVQFCWQQGLPSSQFIGQIRGPGLGPAQFPNGNPLRPVSR